MNWQPLPAAQLCRGLGLGLDVNDTHAVDAYWVWDEISGYARHVTPDAGYQPVLVEFADGVNLNELNAWAQAVLEGARGAVDGADAADVAGSGGSGDSAGIGGIAEATIAASAVALAQAFAGSIAHAPRSRIHSAWLPVADVGALVQALKSGSLLRFQLGARSAFRRDAGFTANAAAPEPYNTTQATATNTTIADSTPSTAEGSPTPLHTLGIIDDGCALAHQNLRRLEPRSGALRSRLLAVWDQEPQAQASDSPHWSRPAPRCGAAYGYGAELSHLAINRLLAAHPGLGPAPERQAYAALGRGDWGGRDHTHGARVLHLLAGPAAAGARGAQGEQTDGGGQGGAPDASLPILFVQLPRQTVADTSGDSIGIQALDGARWIVQRTRDCAPAGADWASTINVSLGSIAGPHDGTSMAEMALSELTDERVTLVMAAGNAANRQGVHAQRSLRHGQTARFSFRVPYGNRRDSLVELWLPGSAADMDHYRISIKAPSSLGLADQTVGVGEALGLHGADGTLHAGAVFARRVAQGRHGSVFLLAVRPTATASAPASQRAGFWHLDVSSNLRADVEVQGWIERDDVIVGGRRGQQTRFEETSSTLRDPAYLNDTHTLSSLAHLDVAKVPGAIAVVGAYVRSARTVSAYSSNGPVRGAAGPALPNWFAPADRSPTLRGLAVPGFFSGERAVIGGTSAAAPQVARRLALEKWAAAVSPAEIGFGDPALPPGRVVGLEALRRATTGRAGEPPLPLPTGAAVLLDS